MSNNNIANTSLSNTNAGITQNITTTSNASSALIKPSSLEEEHKRIHEELEKIVTSQGNTSKVAKEVQSVMQPHFEKEEQLSIPVLGALQPYVNGTLTPEARNQTIELSKQFKQEYPTMLEEHKKNSCSIGKS